MMKRILSTVLILSILLSLGIQSVTAADMSAYVTSVETDAEGRVITTYDLSLVPEGTILPNSTDDEETELPTFARQKMGISPLRVVTTSDMTFTLKLLFDGVETENPPSSASIATAQFNARNVSGEPKSIMLITALYDDNRLQDTALTYETIPSDGVWHVVTAPLTLPTEGLTGKIVKALVWNPDNIRPYTQSATIGDSTPSVMLPSNPDDAPLVSIGKPIDSLFDDYEVTEKWVKFTPLRTGEYRIMTKGVLDTKGTLYDSNFTELAQNDIGSGLDENFCLGVHLEEGQTYYVKIQNMREELGDFSLLIEDVTDTLGDWINAPTLTALDLNNGVFSATASGAIGISGEEKWYKVTTDMIYCFSFLAEGNDLIWALYDKLGGTYVAAWNEDYVNQYEYAIANMHPGVTYYLRLFSPSGATGAYSVNIDVYEGGYWTKSGWEPGGKLPVENADDLSVLPAPYRLAGDVDGSGVVSFNIDRTAANNLRQDWFYPTHSVADFAAADTFGVMHSTQWAAQQIQYYTDELDHNFLSEDYIGNGEYNHYVVEPLTVGVEVYGAFERKEFYNQGISAMIPDMDWYEFTPDTSGTYIINPRGGAYAALYTADNSLTAKTVHTVYASAAVSASRLKPPVWESDKLTVELTAGQTYNLLVMPDKDSICGNIYSVLVEKYAPNKLGTQSVGREYEQTTGEQDGVGAPIITNVHVETIDFVHGKYRLTLENGDFSCGGTPFFFWRTAEGEFTEVTNNNRSVIFTANPGTFDRNVRLTVGIGDALGRAYRLSLILKGNDGGLTPAIQSGYLTPIVSSIGVSLMAAFVDFPDVPAGHWAYKHVKEMSEADIISGYDDVDELGNPIRVFRPDNNTTVGEFLKMLVLLADVEPKFGDSWNSDTGHWAQKYYDYAVGYLPATMTIDTPISREVSFHVTYEIFRGTDCRIWNRLKNATATGADPTFTDDADIDVGYAAAVKALFKNKVVSGYPDGSMQPQNPITRAEISKILYECTIPEAKAVINDDGTMNPDVKSGIDNITVG